MATIKIPYFQWRSGRPRWEPGPGLRALPSTVALMPVLGGRRISLLGRRLFNVLLHRAQELGEQEEYEARLYEIVNDAAYNSKDTAPMISSTAEVPRTGP